MIRKLTYTSLDTSLVAEIEGRPTESLLGVKSGFAIWNWQTKTLKPLVDIRDTDESTARR
jgi:hypothetical protein